MLQELFRCWQPELPIRQLDLPPDEGIAELYDVEAVANSSRYHLCSEPGHYIRDCPLGAGVQDMDPTEHVHLADKGKKKIAQHPTANANNHKYSHRVPNEICEIIINNADNNHTLMDTLAFSPDAMVPDAGSVDSDLDSLDYVAPDFC